VDLAGGDRTLEALAADFLDFFRHLVDPRRQQGAGAEDGGGGEKKREEPGPFHDAAGEHARKKAKILLANDQTMNSPRQSNQPGPIRMSLSSRFENIEMAQHLCSKLLEGWDLSEETTHWILMALREALANAIKHGNAQDLEKRVHLEMDVTDHRLKIRIQDE